MRTLITARYIVAYSSATRDHQLLRDAQLVYEGDSVVFVGRGYAGGVDRTLDFGDSLVSPGFVDLNAAADLEASDLSLDAAVGADPTLSPGLAWSEAYFRSGPRDLSDPDEEDTKYRYMLAKLLACGTTTILPVTGLLHRRWAEGRAEFERLAGMASEMGLRTYLGPSYRDGVNLIAADGTKATHWDEEAGRRGLAEAVEFIKGLGHDPLIRGALIPSTIETCSDGLLRATRRAAEELDVPVRLHATQSRWEYEAIGQRYGKTPVAYLRELGLLNRHFLLPHALHLRRDSAGEGSGEDDPALLAASGATVLHCPEVVLRHGECLDSFRKFRERGIRVALATDCLPPDMILNMRMALLGGRLVEGDAGAVSTADVFRAATLAGADALGRPDLGRLCPGAKADIAVIGLESFHLNAVDDPIRAVVLSSGGRDVTDVIVNGRDALRSGRIPGFDSAGMRRWAEGYFQKLKRSCTGRDYLGRTPGRLFPPVFPEA